MVFSGGGGLFDFERFCCKLSQRLAFTNHLPLINKELKDSPIKSTTDPAGSKWLDGSNNPLARADFGLDDVGTLEVGMKANLNVFDLDSLQIHEPFVTTDWMRRWTQKVDGYVLTLVRGVPTYRQGQPTGALPGSLVRNPRADKSKFKNIARKVSSAFDGFVPEFREEGEDSFEGMGDKGGSAAARLMRETLESGDQARSKL